MLSWRGIWVRLVLIVAAVLWVGMVSAADIPHKINYQGLLSDSATGQPLAGTYDLTLSLYGAPAGGDILWSESKSVTTDQAGVFATVLGSHSALDVPFDSPCWLEVEVEGEVLAPRRELVSVPYAFHALNADSLGGLRSDSYALAGHLHDDLYVNEGQVGSITGGMIGDGEITDADVAAGAAIDPGKIAGTAWTSTTDGGSSGLEADLLDGQHAAEFADASHAHDDRYYTESEVSTADGTVNQAVDPVDWTKLKGMPGGFADGVDNAGAGDGYSLDAVDGDPTDAVYVDNSGNVGIGTTSPARKLHILGEGPRVLVEGSTGNPEVNLKLSGDNSGQVWALYKDSISGDLRFFQNGDRVTIKNGTGAVGIGTDDPSLAKLTVLETSGNAVCGTTNAGIGLYGFSDTGTGVSGASSTGYAGAFTGGVFVSGNLGIGVGTPAHKLDVDGNANLSGALYYGGHRVLSAGDSLSTLALGVYAGSGDERARNTNTFVGNYAGNQCTSNANTVVGHEAGRALTDGFRNVFVGAYAGMRNGDGVVNTYIGEEAGRDNEAGTGNTFVGNVAGMLSSGDKNTFIGAGAGYDNQGSGNVFIGHSAGSWKDGSNMLVIANHWGGDSVLVYGDFTTGRIGLGTVNPERKVHIKGEGPRVLIEASGGNPEVNFKTAGDASSDVWAIYKHVTDGDLHFYQGGDRVTLQDGTGNVGIGTTTPGSYKLFVNGEAYSTVSWSTSDARLKKDLRPIGDALSKVLRLDGLSFLWRTEDYPDRGLPEGRHYGLIAQNVEQVLPEVVRDSGSGEKAVAYSELIPVLVEAVKELKAENDALRERLESVERAQAAR